MTFAPPPNRIMTTREIAKQSPWEDTRPMAHALPPQRAKAARQAANAPKMRTPTPMPRMVPMTVVDVRMLFAAGVLVGVSLAWLIEPIMRRFTA
jgi:hypothetical protein